MKQEIEPGDFIKPRSEFIPTLENILQPRELRALLADRTITEYRIGHAKRDLGYVGAYSDLTAQQAENYLQDLRSNPALNVHVLTRFRPKGEVWMVWDPETDHRFYVPEKMIQTSEGPKTGIWSYTLPVGLDLGEAEGL